MGEQMSRKYSSLKDITIEHILLFMIIYMSSSFWGISISGKISIGCLLIISMVSFIRSSSWKHIDMKQFTFFLGIQILCIFTAVLNQENPYQYVILFLSLSIAYLFQSSLEFETFISAYIDILYFLCIFSLVSFSLSLISTRIFMVFPKVTNNVGLRATNMFFSVIHQSSYFNSNFGIFWEPGAYQTFINWALFFQIFIIKEISVRKILIFVITIFTTFSTTGYISSALLLLIFWMSNTVNSKSAYSKRRIFVIVFLLVIGLVFVFTLLPSQVKFKVFGKLAAISKPDLINKNSAYGSTLARMDSIKIPLINWLKSPMFGVGFKNLFMFSLESRPNFLTATPLNWFGLFGTSLGLLFNYAIWNWTKILNQKLLTRWLIFLFLQTITMSEYYNLNVFYLVLVFYGFTLSGWNSRRKKLVFK